MSKLAELETELAAATQEYEAAAGVERAARIRMCDATNRVNKAQQAIEKEMARLRENAPYQTDWAQKNIRGERP